MSDLVEMAEDLERAERLKRRGMQLASVAQELIAPGWADKAYAALVAIARRQPSLHVDDVRREFSDAPSHPNAWGAVWHRAIREHNIIHSGRVKPSTDPTKHRHQYPVYLSLIYRRES